ncbi:ABC transporter ATP-binding protein [Rathayibacter soli]|uniref:ABC transporter ATP-binding protein n=1 Tax=Rathayibacter soli TaxID=3144168 RepID=UPI0027E5040C|nr:ABC transporter ATP-binding protein [Glaciibacter superstes]
MSIGTALAEQRAPALQTDIVVTRGSFTLDVALTVADGEIVALLGPNGAGKSTLLAALSGLIAPASGTVTVAGRTVTRRTTTDRAHADSAASIRRVAVPPERRRIGLLSQEPLLFPHLSALENVAFGRRVQGMPRHEALRDAAEWLAAVDLAEFGTRKPAALSGGQQQRVAIARALAARPDVLLLDEPLAALDVQTAAHVRRLLAERLRASGTTTILVTHDVLDAIVLADRCAILHDGRIIDDGPKSRVLGHPKNQFIAALAGVNLVTGVSDGADGVRRPDGSVLRGQLIADGPIAAGDPVSAVFAPSAMRVRAAALPTSGTGLADQQPNQLIVTIAGLEPAAAGVRVRLVEDPDLIVELSPASAVALELSAGVRLNASIDPDAVNIRPIGPDIHATRS